MKNIINLLSSAWIWFWYSEKTRIFFVLIPGHFIISIPLMLYFDMPEKFFNDALVSSYIIILIFASIDNDFSKLRKIGLDEHRKKINT